MKILHSYRIGHYNSSVRIIGLLSSITYVVGLNFIHKWRDVEFKIDSERDISEILFTLTITGTHVRPIGLGQIVNDFCRSCSKKEDETILHLLCTYPAIGQRRKRHLGAYYMKDSDEGRKYTKKYFLDFV